MSGIESAAIAIAVLLSLLALGIPIGFAMSSVAIAGMYLVVGPTFLLSTLQTLPYNIASQYTFVVIPMFVLMGGISSRAGIISDLYTAAHRMTSSFKGGLFTATLFASAGFAAVSGSTLVSASVFSKMVLPEMKRYGYNIGVSAGCVAAAGTLAAMIPPSISMVLYAILTDQSIGALLIAGVLPGLFTLAAFTLGLRFILIFRPDWAPDNPVRYTLREKVKSLGLIWSSALLAFLIIGGIYSGLFPPSAAGAVGAAGAIVIALARRRLTLRGFGDSLKEAAQISAVIFIIIIAGLLLSRFFFVSAAITEINNYVIANAIGKTEFLIFFITVCFVLGMFVDGVSVLVITLPFLFPIAQKVGIDPIWFGVIVTKMIEIAAITPPVGLNLYAVLGSVGRQVSSGQLFRGVVPFILIEVIVLGFLVAFPEISLWLPQQMLNR